ncbi:MAG: C40 family peptidase, partial [Salinivirgaceae bacterium]|nr:C40 family peptidase [Salinivirgaceae bacterium]
LPEKSISRSNNKVRNAIIAEATKHEGKPYKYAAQGPESFDCSGFTSYVLNNVAGVKMPHNSTIQSNLSKEIKQRDAKPGDLIFFGNPNSTKVNHTGIVYKAENGEIMGIIHAASKGVIIDNNNVTWTNHWKARVLKVIDVTKVIEALK